MDDKLKGLKPIRTFQVPGVEWEVTLHRDTGKKIAVQYGEQVKRGLNYHEACDELGQCLMHAMSCAGETDFMG